MRFNDEACGKLRRFLVMFFLALTGMAGSSFAAVPIESHHGGVFVDGAGTIRWQDDKQEVRLFGANYCLPSALDYRAAGYVRADRKGLIREDMAHFARMGWDAVRLSFWGDWECCDEKGNLIVNDHLDLLDYLIAEGSKRGMYFLFSPIVTYDARWPEMQNTPEDRGFSRFFEKRVLGTDPAAIAAQQNYLKQILLHRNPYSGHQLKDEPNVLFVEMINEPWHHSDDFAGSVRYINALVDAVKATGCEALTFHNLSQDFKMAGPILRSKADGFTYAWYPSGLVSNHQQFGNFLRYVDDYPPMRYPKLAAKPKLVYEFDMPDVISGYHYPAMVRAFRETGAQFAAMFSYDMLATAPTNLGWQTHVLNLIYTPQKAASAIIAGEAMRRLPSGGKAEPYPSNTRFGDFEIDYLHNYSLLNSKNAFMYSNDVSANPKSLKALQRVVGFGSSPIVKYEGQGIYFLDRLGENSWRLEVYPDAVQVADPFHDPTIDKTDFLLHWHLWHMSISLPGLGSDFAVQPLNAGNSWKTKAEHGTFQVQPGVYLLRQGPPSSLPDEIDRVGLREFVCPASNDSDAVVATLPRQAIAGHELKVSALAVSGSSIPELDLCVRAEGSADFRKVPMQHLKGYRYYATLPGEWMAAGDLYLSFELHSGRSSARFFSGAPSNSLSNSSEISKATSRLTVVQEGTPLAVFAPVDDAAMLAVSRSGESRNSAGELVAGEDNSRVLQISVPGERMPPRDFSLSLFVGDRISARPDLAKSGSIRLRLRSSGSSGRIRVVLVDRDGNAWSTTLTPLTDWKTFEVPLLAFRPCRWALLPQGFPGTWNYWASGSQAKLEITRVERLQLSIRREDQEGSLGKTIFQVGQIDLVGSR